MDTRYLELSEQQIFAKALRRSVRIVKGGKDKWQVICFLMFISFAVGYGAGRSVFKK
jgi:hypothetical protein